MTTPWEQRKYQTVLYLTVWFGSRKIYDAMDGLNIGHCWYRAEQNWPTATCLQERYTASRTDPRLPQ